MKVIFAGGGTAGHVNPALAIAAHLKAGYPSCEIAFSGGRGGIEETLVTREGYPIYTFPLVGLSRSLSPSGLKRNFRAVSNTLSAINSAKKIIRQEQPDIVVGTGGYACFPMVYAAQSLGVKTALLEVNATPGVALKSLAKKADCVMVSFEETKALFPNAKKVVYTGSPVRPSIIEARLMEKKPLFENSNPTVLCFWGSVGAMYMNKKMEDFIVRLAEDKSFNLIIAAGKNNINWMPQEIADKGVDLENTPNIQLVEYIYDMDRVMNACDLVISRAGASTLAEICTCGKASIIVPSPYVTDNHQEKNARALERAGAAKVILENETDGVALFEATKSLLFDRDELAEMAKNARNHSHDNALDLIYQAIMETV